MEQTRNILASLNIVVIMILFLELSYGCSESNPGKPNEKDTIVTSAENPMSEISKLNEDSCSVHWYGGGIFSLCFETGRVYFFFTPQCIYWYPTERRDNRLIFSWALNENCIFDRNLRSDYGLDSVPIIGKPFGEFSKLNDSTLKADYYYPEWVQRVNQNAKDVDTLFPTIFKQKKYPTTKTP